MIWKPIYNYEGYYEISNTGVVRSVNRSIRQADGKTRALKSVVLSSFQTAKRNGHGYETVLLSKQNIKKKQSIHSLVAKHFIPNPHNAPTVNHKDGNKLNNTADNLEWTTYSENNKHAIASGLKVSKRGKENPLYKNGIGCKGTTKKKCLWCGRFFVPILERGIFCSRSCKSLHQHASK